MRLNASGVIPKYEARRNCGTRETNSGRVDVRRQRDIPTAFAIAVKMATATIRLPAGVVRFHRAANATDAGSSRLAGQLMDEDKMRKVAYISTNCNANNGPARLAILLSCVPAFALISLFMRVNLSTRNRCSIDLNQVVE